MNPALEAMLAKYRLESSDDSIAALREIMQELALLGLWRAKFFEHAAFYGGTALRILYGLDRFSEYMDFSLLMPDETFRLDRYLPSVEKELSAWGFHVVVQTKEKTTTSPIESAFLKANTKQELMVIETSEKLAAQVHSKSLIKIKFEVDTNPPPGFETEAKVCLQPIPFSVLAYSPPSLFAGKMHALLCRMWKNRVKGRDWYDFVWYVGRGTAPDLSHLEQRMRQSGHYTKTEPLTEPRFRAILTAKIDSLNVAQARNDVVRFLKSENDVSIWSKAFFMAVAEKLKVVGL